MYGLSGDVDLSFLLGATLLQVCGGENEVILNLDPRASITVASEMRLAAGGGSRTDIACSKTAAAPLLPLLGESVAAVQGAPDGTLTITWASGETLEIFDTFDRYESYTITHGTRVIVV